jgi:hypothetical protein
VEDRRQRPRTCVNRTVMIMIPDRARAIICTVRDLTAKGARLSVPTEQGFPVTFALSFDSLRSMRQCCMKWQRDQEIGVAFVA